MPLVKGSEAQQVGRGPVVVTEPLVRHARVGVLSVPISRLASLDVDGLGEDVRVGDGGSELQIGVRDVAVGVLPRNKAALQPIGERVAPNNWGVATRRPTPWGQAGAGPGTAARPWGADPPETGGTWAEPPKRGVPGAGRASLTGPHRPNRGRRRRAEAKHRPCPGPRHPWRPRRRRRRG